MNAPLLRVLLLAALAGLAGCGSIAPDKPVRATQYDFGPRPSAPSTTAPAGAPLVLDEVDAGGSLDSSAILYRLAYADGHQLRPYALARWTAPPNQLIRQRLREQLGRDRAVLDSGAAVALARRSGQPIHVLRVELEEFSHQFDSPTQSKGVLRLRCTLLENTTGGERLMAQRSFVAEQPAPTPDAPGGVRALAAATDAAAQDIAGWLKQPR
jgi:cholesterol transport system auxiliary component